MSTIKTLHCLERLIFDWHNYVFRLCPEYFYCKKFIFCILNNFYCSSQYLMCKIKVGFFERTSQTKIDTQPSHLRKPGVQEELRFIQYTYILQGLQGFVLNFDFDIYLDDIFRSYIQMIYLDHIFRSYIQMIYLDHIFRRQFASVHINTK